MRLPRQTGASSSLHPSPENGNCHRRNTAIRICQQICSVSGFSPFQFSLVALEHKPHPMGLLTLGTPLPWQDAKHFADHVRSHGITQFLYTWDRLKDRDGDELFWGDEVLRQGFDSYVCELTMS